MTRVQVVVSLLVLSGLATITTQRAGVWHDDRSLWCDAITVAPGKPRPLINCAGALLRDGEASAALRLLERADRRVGNPRALMSRRRALGQQIAVNEALALIALQRRQAARARLAPALIEPAPPIAHRVAVWLEAQP